jgi:PEP-CTERM motif
MGFKLSVGRAKATVSNRCSFDRLAAACCLAAVVTFVILFVPAPAQANSIFGTLSNFDTFNDTPVDSYGAELELEGCHSSDILGTYPSHYNIKSIVDYSNGVTFGTRIKYEGYNFDPSGFLPANAPVQNTNGHACVGTAGCEHFGFSVSTQPTATRFYWLDQSSQRIGTMPASIPNPTWNYIPPAAPGALPRLQAVVQPPEPPEVHPQLPDSIWMKVFVTEIERPVNLDELISGGAVVPEDVGETETEWELLEGGVQSDAEADVPENALAVVRRYEFYKYTGAVDPENNEPISTWSGIGDPPVSEFGDFIAANMVAVNFANPVPEPSAVVLMLIAGGGIFFARRSR